MRFPSSPSQGGSSRSGSSLPNFTHLTIRSAIEPLPLGIPDFRIRRSSGGVPSAKFTLSPFASLRAVHSGRANGLRAGLAVATFRPTGAAMRSDLGPRLSASGPLDSGNRRHRRSNSVDYNVKLPARVSEALPTGSPPLSPAWQNSTLKFSLAG